VTFSAEPDGVSLRRFARPRRWPAAALAVLFLGYAAGKAAFAIQGRLGFPGGPPVTAAETADYFLEPAPAQWFAAASGVVGACLVLLTVAPLGRRIPRRLMLLVLAGVLVTIGYGAGVMIIDGFVGVGVGWRWYHGVLGLVMLTLVVETVRSYWLRDRREAH
jgi:hypothetical protein